MKDYKAELQSAKTFQHIDVSHEQKNKVSGWAFSLALAVFIGVAFSLNVQAQEEETPADTTAENSDLISLTEDGYGFTTVLNIAQMRAFGDYSVREALARIPGFQISRDREVNYRGSGYNTYAVLFNGQRLANSGLGSRNIDLGSFSTDAIRKIEVTKVLDPSMDADALGTTINLSTDQAIGNERSLSAILGGGANAEYISRTGLNNRGWINYAEQFTDEFSLAVNMSYQQNHNSMEELGIEYGAEIFGNELYDVFNRVSPALQVDGRGRFATSVDAFFTPSVTSSYYVRTLFNNEERGIVNHRDNWSPNGGWVDPVTTQGEEGTYSHEAGLRDISTTFFALQGGGDNEFETIILKYNLGWSQSKIDNQDYLFPFLIEDLNYSVNTEDRSRPQMEITNAETQVFDDGTVDRQFLIGQDFDRILEEHINNEFSGRVDVEYPFSMGSLKAGASARLSEKDGEYDENSFDYNRTLRMISFNMLREPNRNVDVINDHYRIPWFVNTDNARSFLETQRPLFTGDDNFNAYQSEIRNYNAQEQIYAGYGMADFRFGRLQLKGGLRLEYSTSDYRGQNVVFDETGEFGTSQEVTQSNDELQLFPNAQLGFDLSESNRVYLAYSQSIDRPDYFSLTPFERIDNQDSTIFRGNHQLEPVIADNVDLMMEQEISNTGIISFSGFYRELSNFTVLRERTLTGQPYDEYEELMFANSDRTATIYGFELAVKQSLSFLPGVLSNLGVYANFMFSESDYETERGELAFPGHSPFVVNTALNYNQGRFSAQLSYHWTDDLLTQIAEEQTIAPSLGSTPIYQDQFEEGFQDLSATLGYQLSDRFHAWANVYNILNTERIGYGDNKEFYPTSTYIKGGLDVRLGVRFDL